MRSLFFRVVVILLCITLCVNFIRITVSGNFISNYTSDQISITSYRIILQDFSKIDTDTTMLFTSISKISYDILNINEGVYTRVVALKNPSGNVLERIWEVVSSPYRFVYDFSKYIISTAKTFYYFIQFVINVLKDLNDILNHLLGFDLPNIVNGGELPDPDSISDSDSVSGGGFGGRR